MKGEGCTTRHWRPGKFMSLSQSGNESLCTFDENVWKCFVIGSSFQVTSDCSHARNLESSPRILEQPETSKDVQSLLLKVGSAPSSVGSTQGACRKCSLGALPQTCAIRIFVWTRFSGDERHMKVSRSAALISLPLFILKEDEFGGLSQVVKSAPYRHGAGWGPLLLHCWSCWATVSHMIRQLFQALLWLLLSCLHHIFTQFIAKSKMTFL